MIELAPTSSNNMTYEEALLYCSFCDHNGNTDWRMPTRDEYDVDTTIYGWTVSENDLMGPIKMWVTPVRDVCIPSI